MLDQSWVSDVGYSDVCCFMPVSSFTPCMSSSSRCHSSATISVQEISTRNTPRVLNQVCYHNPTSQAKIRHSCPQRAWCLEQVTATDHQVTRMDACLRLPQCCPRSDTHRDGTWAQRKTKALATDDGFLKRAGTTQAGDNQVW